jgi:hypothetical protein
MTKRTLEDIALETALGHFLSNAVSAEEYRNAGENWIDELEIIVWGPFEYYLAQELAQFISELETSILAALIEATANEEEVE